MLPMTVRRAPVTHVDGLEIQTPLTDRTVGFMGCRSKATGLIVTAALLMDRLATHAPEVPTGTCSMQEMNDAVTFETTQLGTLPAPGAMMPPFKDTLMDGTVMTTAEKLPKKFIVVWPCGVEPMVTTVAVSPTTVTATGCAYHGALFGSGTYAWGA